MTRSVFANAYCLARYIATTERDPFDLIASLSFDIYGSWVGLYHAEGIVVVLQQHKSFGSQEEAQRPKKKKDRWLIFPLSLSLFFFSLLLLLFWESSLILSDVFAQIFFLRLFLLPLRQKNRDVS